MRFALVLATVACLATSAQAEVRWQLDCKTNAIGTITVKGAEGAGNYAYLTLTVTNNTGRDVPCSLGIWAETDVVGRTYRGAFDPVVKETIERRTGKSYKTLTEARAEKLANGASIDLLVSLGKIDPNVDVLDVNIMGLVDRVYRDKGKTLVEDKVLELHVTRPGDEFQRQNDLLKLDSSKWKLLEPAKELKRA